MFVGSVGKISGRSPTSSEKSAEGLCLWRVWQSFREVRCHHTPEYTQRGETLCLQGLWVKSQKSVSLEIRGNTGEKSRLCGVWVKIQCLVQSYQTPVDTHRGEALYLCRVLGKFQREVTSHQTREYTGEKSYVYGECKVSVRSQVSSHTRIHREGRNPVFAGSVGEASVKSEFHRDQRTHRGEAPFVSGVGEASMGGSISSGSRRHTQERSPMSMGSVGQVSVRSPISAEKRRHTQRRSPMFVGSVGKVSVRSPI
ncbi:unnamed protein product [Rangifer tarandus platyrhynchus]|uniref:Uncharacterized protein n=2 Tax=Rangifer tarandus platyrhynchus TaxID=3082113 RepID=A0ACB1KFD2_RANTA|nr:unnamed protein product [Rangifer tarandus platyrhynchus]